MYTIIYHVNTYFKDILIQNIMIPCKPFCNSHSFNYLKYQLTYPFKFFLAIKVEDNFLIPYFKNNKTDNIYTTFLV